jgi:glycerophosphoryl diester phosphodiesterase
VEEAIDLLAILGLGANIELKPHEGAEAETARTVCAIIEAAWPADLPPPLLSSFAPAALAAARETTPDFARGLLVERLDDAWRAQAESVGAVSLHCDHAGLTAARAREVRAAGYPLLAYTVNHAGRAEELYGWGVVALFSDAPDRLRVGASPG